VVAKHYEAEMVVGRGGRGMRHAVSLIASGEVGLVVNTPQGSGARMDGYEIRTAAVVADVPGITTVPGLSAAVMGIEALIRGEMTVRPLQELHANLPHFHGKRVAGDPQLDTFPENAVRVEEGHG